MTRLTEIVNTRAPLQGLSILVVDDDQDAREMLLAFLAGEGASVKIAAGPPEALALLHDWRPDVIISDLAMPEMTGLEFISAVRGKPTWLHDADIPAIAVTGYSQTIHRWEALRVGFQAFLLKPLNFDLLLETITRVTGHHAA